jgi:hypothetical protein
VPCSKVAETHRALADDILNVVLAADVTVEEMRAAQDFEGPSATHKRTRRGSAEVLLAFDGAGGAGPVGATVEEVMSSEERPMFGASRLRSSDQGESESCDGRESGTRRLQRSVRTGVRRKEVKKGPSADDARTSFGAKGGPLLFVS